MAASKTIYYDSEGNRKIFIGDPRKAPKSAPKKKKAVRREKIKKFEIKFKKPEPAKKTKPQPRMPEPISPTRRKMLDKQKQDQMVKQNLTQDYAYTGTPGAIAEPAGVTIPASKKPKLALRGGGRAYGRNS